MNDGSFAFGAGDPLAPQGSAPSSPSAFLDEEAIAEEEFVNSREDKIENPFVYDSNEQKKDSANSTNNLEMAIGTGNLNSGIPPFNNEEALRRDIKMQDLGADIMESNDNNFPPSGTGRNIDGVFMQDAPESVPVNFNGSMNTGEAAAQSVAVDNSYFANAGQNAGVQSGEMNFANSAATTEAPVENAAPAAGFDMAAATAATAAVNTTMDYNVAAKKKGGKSKIIAGALAAVLVCGGGTGAFFYYRNHESEEKVAADVISQIVGMNVLKTNDKKEVAMNEKAVIKSAEGEFVISGFDIVLKDVLEMSEGDKALLEALKTLEVKLKMSNSENGTAEQSKATFVISLSPKDGERVETTIEAEMLISEDGQAYFKVGGIKAIVDKALEMLDEVIKAAMDFSTEDEEVENCIESSVMNCAEVDESYSTYDDSDVMETIHQVIDETLGTLVDEVDGEWIHIDLDTLLKEELIDEYDYRDFKCALETNKESKNLKFKAKLARLYQENEFLALSPNRTEGNIAYYNIDFSSDKFEAFMTEAESELDARMANNEFCKLPDVEIEDDDLDLDYDFDYDDEDDDYSRWEEEEEDNSGVKFEKEELTLGVKKWSHELDSARLRGKVVADDEDMKVSINVSGDFKFGYVASPISAPAESKEFSKVLKDIEKKLEEKLGSYDDYDDYDDDRFFIEDVEESIIE